MKAAQFPVEQAVLGALLAGPAHGYELRRRLDQGLGPVWRIATSQLYSVLRRLEEDGLARRSVEEQPGRPPRHVYALTPAGEAAFWGWALAPVRHVRDIRVEFLAKLYFLLRYAPDRAEELIAREAQELSRLRRRLSGRQATADRFAGLLRRFRLAQVECVLTWLAECQATLEKEGTCAT
ncbi:MAG: PadR family transcriptional regulator [Candidatus Acetothermia bacterium]|jgi:DNA-binding PadR family transcriptional regulator|nr:PadR family transcriptional regulator [Candidatus Acetothermia bacterium]